MKEFSIKQTAKMSCFEIKIRRKSTFTWSILMFSVMMLYMILFPFMKDMALKEMEAMPKEILAAFGMESVLNLSEFNNYFAMIFNVMLIILCVGAAMRGASSLHDEESTGTAEYLYSNQVSRMEVLMSKLVAAKTNTLIITISAMAAVLIAGNMDESYNMSTKGILWTFVFSFVTQMIFVMVGMVIGALTPKTTKAANLSVGVMFATYMIGYISNIGPSTLDFLKYFSPIDFLSPSMVIQSKLGIGNEKFDFLGLIICLAIIVIAMIAASLIYRKKDLC